MRGITNSQAEWMKYGDRCRRVSESLTLQTIPLLHHSCCSLPGTGAKQPVHAGTYFATQKVSLEESVLSQVTTAIQMLRKKLSTPAMAP